MTVETGTLFELCTKQTSDPLLFQFGMMRVETFDKVVDFLKRASAVPPRARVVATTDAEIQTLNFQNISPPFIGCVRLNLPFMRGVRNIP
jgi:hypothetical protein